MKLNTDKLVKFGVPCSVIYPIVFAPFEISHDGHPMILPSVGGIVYNVKVGDPAFGWQGDHIEPCVSAVSDEKDRNSRKNRSLNSLACIGNRVRITSGDAKGSEGVVTGFHGGVEHVLIDFSDEVLSKINYGDSMLIEAYGQGLEIDGFKEIRVVNIDPALFIKIAEVKENKLSIKVRKKVPPYLMGSGLGFNDISSGDYDIMVSDQKILEKYRLNDLRLGDIVAIEDHDCLYGRTYKKGMLTIGIVVHSSSFLSGHGPGVTTILSGKAKQFDLVFDDNANIADILKIGRRRNG